MISSIVRRNRGFISAGLLASHRKLRPRRYGSYRQQQQPQFQFKEVRFQLYNAVQQSWAQQINNPPILLTDEDIKNWLTFKVNKLRKINYIFGMLRNLIGSHYGRLRKNSYCSILVKLNMIK